MLWGQPQLTDKKKDENRPLKKPVCRSRQATVVYAPVIKLSNLLSLTFPRLLGYIVDYFRKGEPDLAVEQIQ